MATLDEKTALAAEQILKRPLNDEERFEIYRIADVLGMKDIQSFLHLLLVFKLHENTMNERFAEIASLEKRIQDTLESSIESILGEGAARIGADMGEAIAERSMEIMSSVDEFYSIKGYIVATSITGIVATVAYWFGVSGTIRMDEISGPFRGVLLLPSGWWMLFSVASYTYFWFFSNWSRVKSSMFHKCILAALGIIMAVLLICML
jgi:hypothetical protein